MKILVTYDMFREGFTELESKYEVTFPEGRDFTYEEVFEMIPEYDVLCSMFDFPVNKELIDHASKLRLIANYAVGYNNIDVAYALEKGLTVANTPDPVTAPTANIALGLMLDTARRITECDRKLRTLGKDMKVGVLENLGMPVTGQTLGIIGMGRIGKALAKRANALGMDVIYHNRRQLCIEDETKLNVTYVSKEELLAKADFVSLNAPYTPDTYHILGEEEFKQMKPSAILINTARGPLVDEHALVKALREGTIHGAGLDVFEFGDYPLPELLEMDNVVLTPHIGTQTMETRIIMARTVCNNVIGFLEGDRPVSRVLPAMTAAFILSELQSVGTPEKAVHLSRFFKTGPGQYGEGDQFLGVVVPQTRSIAKANKATPFDELQLLLDSPWHEARLCALLILVYRFQDRKAMPEEREAIFRFYLKNMRRCNNWDLVDLTCRDIVGEYLVDKDRSLLYRLAESENLWEQRISIVSTWAFIRRNDFGDTLELSERLIGHKHDLMHKAVGWMLREVGKKERQTLTDFLERNATRLPRTALRYAIEHYPEPERQYFLKKK